MSYTLAVNEAGSGSFSAMKVGAFTAVCGEDLCWVSQYLREAERVQVPFAVHFDRWFCQEMAKHPLCIGWSRQTAPEVEFSEQQKQDPFNILVKEKFDWALSWDIDETWEASFRPKLDYFVQRSFDYAQFMWLNFHGDAQHIRIDGPFCFPPRVKLYNIQGKRRWVFDHPITNGCKMADREPVLVQLPLVCLHHGLMTHELRELHMERWNRVYTAAVGANPYGVWSYAVNEPPVVVPYP